MIVQGTNLPILFKNIPDEIREAKDISATIYTSKGIEKHWGKDDLLFVEDGLLAPLTQTDTLNLTPGFCKVTLKFTTIEGLIDPGIEINDIISGRRDRTFLNGELDRKTVSIDYDLGLIEVEHDKLVYKGYSPYIGPNGNWFAYDDTLGKFVDTGVFGNGYILKSEDKEEIARIIINEDSFSTEFEKKANTADVLKSFQEVQKDLDHVGLTLQRFDDRIATLATKEAVELIKTVLAGKADTSKVTAIENTLNSKANKTDIPKKTSQLTNDSGYIDKYAYDLAYYYTKSQVNNLVSAIPKFEIKVVSVLPTSNISSTTIYLVPSSDVSGNRFGEWIYVENKWELIGSFDVDLTDYVKKNDIVDIKNKVDNMEKTIDDKIAELELDVSFDTNEDGDIIIIGEIATMI